jgi:predicted porin
MNKKLITLAVAAAMAAPVAAMADATMYGKIHLSIDYVDVDEYANWANFPAKAPVFPPSADDLRNPSGVTPPPYTAPFYKSGATGVGPTSSYDVVDGHTGGMPVSAAAAYVDALAYGTATTEPVPAFGATFLQEYQRLTDQQHVPDEVAYYQAIRLANQAALRSGQPGAATAAQLQAAVYAGMMAGAGGGYNGWDVAQRPGGSRFGIKGSEDLGSGLKAIWQIELGIDVPEGSLSTSLRNSFVGLAGDWGTFLVGRHDTPYKISTGKLDMFSDTMADFNLTVGFDDQRASNAIAYISPSFSGFQFAGAVVSPGKEFTYTDLYTGATKENYADSLADAYSLAVIYKNGPFYGSVAYESFSDKMFNGDNNNYQALYGQTASDDTKWKIGLGLLDWNGFSMTGVYEARSNVFGAPSNADSDLWQIQAGYAFGNNMVKAMYGQADVNACADNANRGFRYTCSLGYNIVDNQDKSTWAIGFDHNFSKRTQVYALYTALDDDIDNADWSGFSLGMQHAF